MVKKHEAKKAEVILAIEKYIHIRFADVIKILAMIDEYSQSDRLAARTNGKEHTVRVPSETVNIVKEFVAAHPEMSQHPTGKKVVSPPAKKASGRVVAGAVRRRGGRVDPCDCSFSSGG
jgi:hypothetical protein